MKKKFVALLMSAVMVSGSLALPVYAADEETEIESADDAEDFAEEEPEESNMFEESEIPAEDAEDFSDQPEVDEFSTGSEPAVVGTAIGGNISWGSSDSILPTDMKSAREDRVFLGIKGSYITDTQNALKRINEIRKEACDEGVRDPRNENRNLTSSDYVPIKWSSDLEYIARIRAAEASVYRQHIRLNGYNAFAIYSPNGIQSFGEVLAWNQTQTFLKGIEQWYSEKKDWVGNTGKVTGHYTQMIDPDNTYVGLATFINPNAVYPTTTAGEYTSQSNLDESAGPDINNCIQTVEVRKNKITANMPEFKNSLAAKDSVQAEFNLTVYGCKMELFDKVNWTSSDTKTATVDDTGVVTGVHEGSADITASYGDFTVTRTIQVTGHPNTELKNAKEATCSEEGYTGDKICKDCGKTVESGKSISKKEHTWDAGKVTRKATCEEAGEKTYTCQSCGKVKTEEIKATGHNAVTDPAVAATCEKEGKTEGKHCSVCGKILTEQKVVKATGHTWDTGKVTRKATCEEAGEKTYTCQSCGKVKTEEIKATGHKYGAWKTVSPANVFSAKKQKRTCTVCGKSEEKTVGNKLPKTMTVNISSISLKTGQKTTALKVSGLAKGDSIVSWKSNNTGIAKIVGKSNGTSTITAGKKTGKTTITIILKSGLKKNVTVAVQKTDVKTTKISGIAKTLNLKTKQSVTLKPVIAPVTSLQKVTYTSSNKTVAAVSTNGKITARKKGTAVITVKSGSKSVKCKVTVK